MESAIKNCFNVDDVHIVPAQGQSGGMWLLVKNEVEVDVLATSRNLFLAICNLRQSRKTFGMVCMYDDPHHKRTAAIWSEVRSFVVAHSYLPILCMDDLNNIMNAYKKKGPTLANLNRIAEFILLSCQELWAV